MFFKKSNKKMMFRQILLSSMVLFLASCQKTFVEEGSSELISVKTKTQEGLIVSDVQSSTDVGTKILEKGGNAVDASVAMMFHLGVVAPSRVSLLGGGVCQVYFPKKEAALTVDFTSKPFSPDVGVGIPSLPRGAFKMQARYGRKSWKEVLNPALDAAKEKEVSLLSKKDLALFEKASQFNASLFSSEVGEVMDKPLENKGKIYFLKQLQQNGTGVLYNGEMAQLFLKEALKKGYALNEDSLKNYKPQILPSKRIETSKGIFFLQNEQISGEAGSILLKALTSSSYKEQRKANEVLDSYGQGDIYPLSTKAEGTGFVVQDKSGMIVSCALSQGKMFGLGTYLDKFNTFLPEVVGLDENKSSCLMTMIFVDKRLERSFASSVSGMFGFYEGMKVGQDVLLEGVSLKRALLKRAQERFTKEDSIATERINSFLCTKTTCQGLSDLRGNGKVQFILKKRD